MSVIESFSNGVIGFLKDENKVDLSELNTSNCLSHATEIKRRIYKQSEHQNMYMYNTITNALPRTYLPSTKGNFDINDFPPLQWFKTAILPQVTPLK